MHQFGHCSVVLLEPFLVVLQMERGKFLRDVIKIFAGYQPESFKAGNCPNSLVPAGARLTAGLVSPTPGSIESVAEVNSVSLKEAPHEDVLP